MNAEAEQVLDELKPCPFCGKEPSTYEDTGYVYCPNDDCMVADSYWEKAILPVEKWNTRPIEDALNARIAELEAENVNLSKKVTDYEKELRQSYKYDKTCSTCRYLDENRDCVLGIRCVNYTLWQGKIL